jgi:hypothetical protein
MKSLIPFLFSACLVGSAAAAGAPASVAELFGMPANLQLVREADKVDACILHHIEPVPRTDGSMDWSKEHYEETTFTPVPAATVTVLRDLLLSEKTYDWASASGRRPQFYLRLRFHRNEEVIAIDFCFMCHVLSLSHKGGELGHANFSPNADLFLQAFLKVFPDDEPLKDVAREAGLPL